MKSGELFRQAAQSSGAAAAALAPVSSGLGSLSKFREREFWQAGQDLSPPCFAASSKTAPAGLSFPSACAMIAANKPAHRGTSVADRLLPSMVSGLLLCFRRPLRALPLCAMPRCPRAGARQSAAHRALFAQNKPAPTRRNLLLRWARAFFCYFSVWVSARAAAVPLRRA